MKTLQKVVATALLISLAACSTSAAQAATKDSVCLALGRFAATVADSRAVGRTEEYMIAFVKGEVVGAATEKMLNVTSFVYTMQLDKPDAAKLVYLKCLNNDFN